MVRAEERPEVERLEQVQHLEHGEACVGAGVSQMVMPR